MDKDNIEISINGNNVVCKLIASFIMKNKEYVVLLNEKDNEAYAFSIIEEQLQIIEDEKELNDVMTILHKGYKH
ncbi:DUF1292 domain-containing protein [Clostridiaceae bacterium M8S5]|nr:DUF1292 domain-containing protein [Clostridiaceae bacterium M8S5]